MNLNQAYKDFLVVKKNITNQEKGAKGENLAFTALKEYQNNQGKGVIYHSFSYKYAIMKNGKQYPGNIKKEGNKFILTTEDKKNTSDEIDLLYVTRNKLIVIEVKAYGSGTKIVLNDDWFTYKGQTESYPVAQTEKHCRHLYHRIYDVLPNGNPSYIVGILVFVDKMILEDARSAKLKKYIRATNLNGLKRVVNFANKSGEFYLDEELVNNKLNLISTGTKGIFK